jgi:hypothetical protein
VKLVAEQEQERECDGKEPGDGRGGNCAAALQKVETPELPRYFTLDGLSTVQGRT